MEQSEILQMINVIPEPYRSRLIALALMMATLSYVLIGVKRFLPIPDPKAGRFQAVAFWVLHVADLAAGNSTTIKTLAAELQRSKRYKIPPPMPLLMLAVLCSSCATAQALTVAKASSAAVHQALADVGGEIIAQAMAEEDRVFVAYKTQDTAGPALALVRDKWRPIEQAFDRARLAHAALIDAINLAESTRTKPPAETAGALLAAWQSMADAAKAAGVRLPSPPEALQALSGGVL